MIYILSVTEHQSWKGYKILINCLTSSQIRLADCGDDVVIDIELIFEKSRNEVALMLL